MRREVREILVGVLVLFCVVGLLAFPYRGESAASGDGSKLVTATFNRVDGLVEGDAVRLGGIAIGQVDEMALDSYYRAVVTLRINEGVDLPSDTSAAVHTDGLFGSKFIVLEPGGAETMMKSGDQIEFTQDSMVVSDLLELIISQGKANQAENEAAEGENDESSDSGKP